MNFGSNLKKGSLVINDSPKKIEANFKKKLKEKKKAREDENFIEIAKRSIKNQSKRKIPNQKSQNVKIPKKNSSIEQMDLTKKKSINYNKEAIINKSIYH